MTRTIVKSCAVSVGPPQDGSSAAKPFPNEPDAREERAVALRVEPPREANSLWPCLAHGSSLPRSCGLLLYAAWVGSRCIAQHDCLSSACLICPASHAIRGGLRRRGCTAADLSAPAESLHLLLPAPHGHQLLPPLLVLAGAAEVAERAGGPVAASRLLPQEHARPALLEGVPRGAHRWHLRAAQLGLLYLGRLRLRARLPVRSLLVEIPLLRGWPHGWLLDGAVRGCCQAWRRHRFVDAAHGNATRC
mmetsp:Transcript_123237/g.349211  ORF Transcript_123237/g.349211 Transcript_123237/m.349211 type:complete len:248 (-) Transcript_123237:413-1156(-)